MTGEVRSTTHSPRSTMPSPPSGPLASAASTMCRRMMPLPELAEPVEEVAPNEHDAAQAVTLREARWADVEAARAAVLEAEAAVARHRAATEGLVDLEAELARCGIEEEQAAASVAEAEADVALANGPAFDASVAAVVEAEAALARSAAREGDRTTGDRGGRGQLGRRCHGAGGRGACHQRRAPRDRGRRRRAGNRGIVG